MLVWTIDVLHLDLRYTWKISRNATDFKKNLIVTVTDGTHIGKGEAAPNVRYGESPESCSQEFDRFIKSLPDQLEDISQLHYAMKIANTSHALSFAIESAYIHYSGKKNNQSVAEQLKIVPHGQVPTSYTIPIMETGKIKLFYAENNLGRFPFIKLKVNVDDAFESLNHLLSFSENPIMVDANEAFKDVEECIRWLEKIKKMPLVFVEQPLPSEMKEESIYLKKHCPFPLMADEAVTDQADFEWLKRSFDGINMKLMKAGGYLNGLRLLNEAKANNMRTMIGCMVETTLGISSAMNLCSLVDYADLDSFILLKDEPFGLIDEKNGVLTNKIQ